MINYVIICFPFQIEIDIEPTDKVRTPGPCHVYLLPVNPTPRVKWYYEEILLRENGAKFKAVPALGTRIPCITGQ